MQTQQADAGTSTRKPRKQTGRKDNSGQEQVIEHGVIAEREDELVRLFKAAEDAGTDFSDANKKAAEDSGYNAGALRKYIAAKAGDKFAAEKKRIVQLALLFDVDGED